MKLIYFKKYKELTQDIPKYKNLKHNQYMDLYISYIIHEAAWWDYFQTIFLKNFSRKIEIQLVFWESGPMPKEKKNNVRQLPWPNYAFYMMEKKMEMGDSYLKNVCNKCHENKGHAFTEVLFEKKRKDILENLSQNNFLIVDLLPTHGVNLNKQRNNCYTNLFQKYTIEKLIKIKAAIKKKNKKFSSTIFYPKNLQNDFIKAIVSNRDKIKDALDITNKEIDFQPLSINKEFKKL